MSEEKELCSKVDTQYPTKESEYLVRGTETHISDDSDDSEEAEELIRKRRVTSANGV